MSTRGIPQLQQLVHQALGAMRLLLQVLVALAASGTNGIPRDVLELHRREYADTVPLVQQRHHEAVEELMSNGNQYADTVPLVEPDAEPDAQSLRHAVTVSACSGRLQCS